MKKLFLLAFLVALPALAEDSRLVTLVKQGDAEERAGRTRAALSFYRDAEQIEPRNVGVLLRIAKQYGDLVGTAKPREMAEQLAQKSLLYAERAVEIDPKVAKGHLSVAIAYGKLTDFVGNKEKLEYSKLIKQETLKSIALDPKDDFAWHVLGRWHSGVANVSGVLKMMAGLVYGGLPTASNEEAVRCLKKAAEIAPQRIIHHSELARVYAIMGRKELEDSQWRMVLALPAVDKEDEKDQHDARAALNLPKGTLSPLPKPTAVTTVR